MAMIMCGRWKKLEGQKQEENAGDTILIRLLEENSNFIIQILGLSGPYLRLTKKLKSLQFHLAHYVHSF